MNTERLERAFIAADDGLCILEFARQEGIGVKSMALWLKRHAPKLHARMKAAGMNRIGKAMPAEEKLERLRLIQSASSRADVARKLGLGQSAINQFLYRNAPYGVEEAIEFFEAELEGAEL